MDAITRHVIAALDAPTWEEARPVVQRLWPRVRTFKVGLTLFVREGARPVAEIQSLGADVFLDLKLHDIPMQVAGAVAAAARLGVRWLSLHTAGGERMLRDAVAALPQGASTGLLGISVLTSLDQEDLRAIGVDRSLADAVTARAALASKAGIHGLVCSPHEIALVRERLGPDAAVVTPGIRLATGPVHDQKRVMGPAEALRAGASHLVIGRALTDAGDVGAALAAFEEALA